MSAVTSIRRVNPAEHETLSQIALLAKEYWNYPEHWMELWRPQLTFDATYFVENESWLAESASQPIAFYTLQDRNGIAWVENMWVLPDHIGQGVGRQLFLHAVDLAANAATNPFNWKLNRTPSGFMRKWGCERSASVNMNWMGSWHPALAGDGLMKNLGPKSSGWLASIGVHSLEDVATLGVVETYKRVKAAYPEKVTLNMLWGLYAALLDIPWNELPPDIKEQLRKEAGE